MYSIVYISNDSGSSGGGGSQRRNNGSRRMCKWSRSGCSSNSSGMGSSWEVVVLEVLIAVVVVK